LQSGATISDSSLDFTSSTFKPSGTVSVTNGGSLSFAQNSSVKLEGATTLSQSGSVSWPSPDLNGNALTLNVDSMTLNGALSIGTGESLNSGTSNLSLNSTLTIDDGGTLSSDNGSVTISSGLALNNGELVQGGGILNLISGGTVLIKNAKVIRFKSCF